MITYPLNNIEYSAEDAELFHVTRTSGVYANNSFDYSLLGGNDIEIGIGIAWIKNSEFAGKVVAEKKSTVINMGITDAVYPRIDAIVIQFNAETNETTFVVKQGTPATSPIAPEVVRTSNIYELHLYHILRPAGAVSLSAANITDMRLSPEHCGIMADSVTSVDTKAIQQQINAFIENTSTQLNALANETEQKYIDVNNDINDLIVDAQGNIDGLVSATQIRLDDIVADTDGKISEEVTSQLTEAKESGEFDGVSVTKVEQTQTSTEDGGTNEITVSLSDDQTFKFIVKNGAKGGKGDKGVGVLSTVLNEDFTLTINLTDGTSYTTPSIRGEIGKTGNGIKSAVLNADYTLTLTFTDNTTYTTPSIRGAKGTDGVSITSVTQTTTASGDGGTNVITVTLSNGQAYTFEVKNGTKGSPGTTDFTQLSNKPTTETWTFTLEDGSTVTKAVYVG